MVSTRLQKTWTLAARFVLAVKALLASLTWWLRRPYLTRRAATAIVTVMLAAKLGATAHNMAVSNLDMYDKAHHLERAESAGFELSRRYYNPPLYYTPIAPIIKQPSIIPVRSGARRGAIITFFRCTNFVYLSLFYVCWLYFIFPMVLPTWQASFLASVLLLSLPGYQRIANMVHPDNLLSALTALGFALWLFLERRTRAPTPDGRRLPLGWKWALVMGLVIGLTGATRPFSIVPVAVFSLGSLWLLVYRQASPWRQLFSKGLVAASLIAVLSGSWWAYRLGSLPTSLTDVYFGVKRYGPYRPTFDWNHYFTSFYYDKLMERPNRDYRDFDRTSASQPSQRSFFFNKYSNSFFTLLYSDVWADHWLYFSGGGKKELRADEKRRALSAALLPTITLALMGVGRLGVLGYRALRRRWPTAGQTVLLALALLGLGLFLQWQTGDALKPGKQSTVKFLYIAYCVPAVVAVPFVGKFRGAVFNVLATMLALLFLAVFPMSVALRVKYGDTVKASSSTSTSPSPSPSPRRGDARRGLPVRGTRQVVPPSKPSTDDDDEDDG